MARKVEGKRWRRDISEHLEQFPRQYAALESAMAAFGGELDLKEFKTAQVARATIEHGYLQVSAGDVHRAAELVHDAARDFIGRYRAWVGPHLEDGGREPS